MLLVLFLTLVALHPAAAQYSPAFYSEPQSQTAPAGSDVSFSFSAINYSLSFWLFNETNIVTGSPPPWISTDGYLYLTNVQAKDAGEYRAVIGGEAPLPDGWVWNTSHAATLTVVPSAPYILTHPPDFTAPAGLPALLSVNARGTEPLQYRWHLNGDLLPSATNATLVLSNAQPTDAGTYQVTVFNALDTTNVAITLTVGPVVKWGPGEAMGFPYQPEQLPPVGLSNVQAIAAGWDMSVALESRGSATAWGYWGGAYGSSNALFWADGVAAVAAGSQRVFALKTNGTVACLSLPYYGAPGFLVEPPTNRANIVSVCGVSDYSLVLQADGTPAVFGRPDLDPPPWATNLVAVAGGDYHALGLRHDGTVVGWGRFPTATNTPPGLSGITQIAAGGFYSLALKFDGHVVGWDANGILLTNIPPVLTNAVAVSAFGDHSIALTASGSVLEWWGSGACTNPLPTLSNLVAVAAGAGHSLALEGEGKPFFTEQPVDQTAIAGQTSVLRAQPVGARPMFCQWQHNGTAIADATNWFLTRTPIVAEAAGGYALVASNAFGVCTSRVANVRVLVLPTITLQPTNQLVSNGATVTLQAQAAGPGALTYHWKKYNRNVRDDDRILGAGSDTLTISNATQRDIGVYRLEVSNTDGLVSTHLTVIQVGQTTLAGWGENSYREAYVPADLTNVLDVISGGAALAVQFDGTLRRWGGERSGNYYDALGPPDLSNVVSVAGGPGLAALCSDGTVFEWGDNAHPPAGLKDVVALQATESHYLSLKADGTITAWNDPHAWWTLAWSPPDLTNVVAICANRIRDLALKADGTVVAWSPTLERPWEGGNPPTGLSNIVAIATSDDMQFALNADGTVTAWSVWDGSPAPVPAWWTNITALSAYWSTCLALTDSGRVYAYYDEFGSTNVPAGLTNVLAVKASFSDFALVGESSPYISTQPLARTAPPGSDVVLQVTASGTHPFAYQWRVNDAPIPNATNAVLVLTNAQAISAGTYSVTITNASGAVTSAGARLDFGPILAWGINDGGVLDVPPGLTNVVAVQARGSHAVTLDTFGKVANWGFFWSPLMAVPTNLVNVKAISAGAGQDFALLNDGTVTSWGLGWNGETNVPPGLSNVVQVAAGEYHCLALKADGSVLAWGDSPNGQTNVPDGLSDVVALSGGGAHSLALKSDGTVVMWGGDFTYAGPLPEGLTNILAIAAGNQHSLALKADGTVVAWGGIGSGETNVPAGLSNVVAVAAGSSHSMALRADGSVVSWGNPTPGVTNVPAQASNVVAIAGGQASSFALLGDGRPQITAQPVNRTGTRYATLTLNARAAGAGQLYYQWLRDGVALPGATSATLIIDELQASDNGAYRCIVSNALGSAISSAAIVAADPLRFDTRPGGMNVTDGLLHLKVLGASGRAPLVLFATTDFLTWEPLLTNDSALGPLELLVPFDSSRPHQFYRVAEIGLPPAKPLRIELLTIDTAALVPRVCLRLRGLTGQGSSVVFTSPDASSWLPCFTNAPTFGELEFTDNVSPGTAARFYRAAEQR